jgi:hypothetical protein
VLCCCVWVEKEFFLYLGVCVVVCWAEWLDRAKIFEAADVYVAGLLGENDFGCRTGVDEFILICSGQQGVAAQRRLSNISERLWDFQLRGLGTFTILFSWGGVDVQNEPLSDAVASATERMYQTKRSRKTVSMDSVSNRRQAV